MLYFAHPPVVCYVYGTVIVCQLERPGRVYDFFSCAPPGGAACTWYCYRFLLQESSMR